MRLAVDGFGHGAAELAVLDDIEVDMFKIDRTFVSTLGGSRNRRGQAVVRALTTLAHDLGSIVTAVGIESAEQQESARALGCDAGQGVHLAEPAPPSLVTAWLEARVR